MRRVALGLGIVAVVCLATVANAQDIYDCYNGSTEQGGNRITVNGIQSNQYVQQSYPGATVTVYVHNTVTLATIWQDAAGTVPLANPFTSSSHSVAFVCAADGRYDFKYSGSTITVPFTVSDIKFCFACSGGGGGSVGPGTINQVAKFTATNNVGNSSGGPDDGTNPVPWTNGLSVNDSGYNKRRPNGANCTTQNLLVEYDGSVIGGLASVQTAVVSSQHVIGVAGQGASCSGNVQIVDHAFHACTFDNQTVIGDAVISSPTTIGYCSDGGGSVQGTQVVGRVASLNTGTGTLAIVDWFTGDTSQAAGTITSCATGGSNAYYPGIGNVIACDPLVTDDGAGHMTMKGAGFTDSTFAGYWYQTQGALIAQASMNANSFYFSPGTSVSASYGLQPPVSQPTAGNCVQWAAGDATGYTKFGDSGAPCGTGSGTEVQVNGVDTTAQTPINFADGTATFDGYTITESNPSAGNIKASLTTPNSQISTPSAPTLANNNAAGARSITYEVQLCEDGPTCSKHTHVSSTQTIANANASPQVQMTAFADTIFGWRCADIYVTADSGARTGVPGRIANCVWKSFIDTGANANGVAATDTNNTVLIPTMNPSSGGCNYPAGSAQGKDGLPCSPKLRDDEFTWGNGSFTPGDANNPFWLLTNLGTSSMSLTGGELAIEPHSGSGSQVLELTQLTPSTPYKVEEVFYFDWGQVGQSAEFWGGICATDNTKIVSYELKKNSLLELDHWSSNTTKATTVTTAAIAIPPYIYLQLGDDGTTFTFSHSFDGVTYAPDFTEARNAYLTGVTRIGLCANLDQSTGHNTIDFDYWRQTQ